MQDKDELHPYTMSCYSKLYELLFKALLVFTRETMFSCAESYELGSLTKPSQSVNGV